MLHACLAAEEPKVSSGVDMGAEKRLADGVDLVVSRDWGTVWTCVVGRDCRLVCTQALRKDWGTVWTWAVSRNVHPWM